MKSEKKHNLWRTQARDWDTEKSVWAVRKFRLLQAAFALSLIMGVGTSAVLGVSLARARTPVPILLHERDDGSIAYASVAHDLKHFTTSHRQIESDIFHYVQLQESYHPVGLLTRFNEVQALSTPDVARNYRAYLQKTLMPYYDDKAEQKVRIQDISIISEAVTSGQDNIAHVHFTVDDGLNKTSTRKVAVISWDYGVSSNEVAFLWHNPLGFIVERYDVNDSSFNHEGKGNDK